MSLTDRAEHYRQSNGLARWERATDWPMTALALAFLLVLIAPLAVTLTDAQATAVAVANVLIWLAFALDYAARLCLALKRWAFVKAHPLDLIVVAVPFLRPLRLLRLFAIVGVASRRAGHGLHGRATVYVVGVALVVMLASALVVYEAERDAPEGNIDSIGDALWWSATTVTTVGYGDAFPTTLTGRLTAVALMLTGIALIGVLTAAVAAWFIDRLRAEEAEEVDETLREVRALREELAELRRELHGGPEG